MRVKCANRMLLVKKLAHMFMEQARLFLIPNHTEEPSVHNDGPKDSRIYHTTSNVCLDNTQQLSWRITPPTEFSHTYNEDEQEEKEIELSAATVILTRTHCRRCDPQATLVSTATLRVPTGLWWRSVSKGPDDCPLCHKVLFHRENPQHLAE